MDLTGDTLWLIDKSAFARLSVSPDHDVWANRIERGLVRISTVTLLEIGYSARTATDLKHQLTLPPIAAMPIEYSTPAAEARAIEVVGALAARGQHRGPSIPDLLIAAIAEHSRLTVLHLDKDYELIAQITHQPTEQIRTH